MKVFEDAWNREDLPRGAVATIGNYDGVHLGQRTILNRVVERSRHLGVPSSVVTFEPHPAKVLSPQFAPRCLTTRDQKQRLLAEAGIDQLFLVRFDEEFAGVGAQEFVDRFLVRRLSIKEVYVGSRFVFGHRREGDLELMQRLLAESGGGRARGVEEVASGSQPISSTRIREAIATGNVGQAAEFLGRPYEIQGTVVHGAGEGRKLGWPTVNIQTENELIPAHGVYVSTVLLEDERDLRMRRPSVSNVGVRPTLHSDSETTVECHLLDFRGDLYGRQVSVEFLARLRGEQAFPSLEALKSQIEIDVEAARGHFDRASGRSSSHTQIK